MRTLCLVAALFCASGLTAAVLTACPIAAAVNAILMVINAYEAVKE